MTLAMIRIGIVLIAIGAIAYLAVGIGLQFAHAAQALAR